MSSRVFQATDAPDPQSELHYKYDMLPEGQFARYIILQPSMLDTDPLVCTVHYAHLDDIPSFEAISYAWGTPVKKQLITCSGKIIQITDNLHDALCQIRLTNKPRTLWVDSICINQADPKEQGHQVSLMAHIYKKSRSTLICLGASNHNHAPIVGDLVADVSFMIQNICGRAEFEWVPNSFPFPKKEEPLLSHCGWESFGVLLQQPWFRRGWVIQEAALGRDAIVHWANTVIDWLNLVRTYTWYIRRALTLPNFEKLWLSDLHMQAFYVRQHREAITFRHEGATTPFTLLETLDYARWHSFTDPRDRIYAFLHLPSSDALLPTMRPSYEVPYIDVYRDFACQYLRRSGDLDILHFVHNDNSALASDFPSWIPRWDVRLYSSYTGTLNNYNRFGSHIISRLSSPKITVSLDQTTLKLRTVIIDIVKFTAPGFDKNSTTPNDVVSLWETVSTRPTPLPYRCSPLRAFVEIFRCGVYRGQFNEWKTLESAYMRLLQREISQGDASYGNAEYFHNKRMEDVHNKAFIITQRGYHGLAPNIVQDGDICCIIFGTRSPFILRRTDRDGHYKLVGSVLMLSKELNRNGYPNVLGCDEDCTDWVEWGLEEEDIFLL